MYTASNRSFIITSLHASNYIYDAEGGKKAKNDKFEAYPDSKILVCSVKLSL